MNAKFRAIVRPVALIVPILLLVTSCSSLSQKSDEVWIRHGTNGRLEFWKPLKQAAQEHWPYAWASISAYQYDKEKGHFEEYHDGCPDDPAAVLRKGQWKLWEEIPALGSSSELGRQMGAVHLRVQVWSNEAKKEVIVAFGGTHGVADLKADLRWTESLFGVPNDQYHVLFSAFTPAFLQIWETKINTPDWAWLRFAHVVSTGHSLGGGLAQGFAYAASTKGLRVAKVVAFDPSPVSGKREVSDWASVATGIEIQRIYNRGELLAIIRSGFNTALPPRAKNAVFTDIRYAPEWHWSTPLTVAGSVRAHFLRPLACTMAKQAGLAEQSEEKAPH